MYCPRCSQEQVSEQMRFCSRCGFPLTIVSQLVTSGGMLKGFDQDAKIRLSPRQKGILWGVILMAVSVLLFPTAAFMTAMKSDLVFVFLPVFLIFLVGLVRLLRAYSRAPKISNEIERSAAAGNELSAEPRSPALPAGQTIPATNWKQPVTTSEMARHVSVTENTTTLLSDVGED